MPQEDLKIKFDTQGADKAARDFDQILDRVKKMRSSTEELTLSGVRASSSVFGMKPALEAAKAEISKTTEHVGSMSRQMRTGASVIAGTFGRAIGEVNPALGAMIGSLRMGAMVFASLGGPIAIAVVGLQLLTQAVMSYIEKMKMAREAQLKFAASLVEFQLAGVDRAKQRVDIESEAVTAGLELEKQRAEAGAQNAASLSQLNASLAHQLELSRDLELQERSRLTRQLELTRAAAELDKDLAVKRAEQEVAPLREKGLDEQADALVKIATAKAAIAAQSKIEAANAALAKADMSAQMKMEVEQRQAKKDALAFERDRMTESLELARQWSEVRLQMIDSTLSEEDRARAAQKIRVDMIDSEIKAVKELAAAHSENAELQRQTGARLIGLAQQKMKAEIDAVTAVLDARRRAAEEEKRIEEAKASAGKGLRGEAIQALKARGRKGATETEITAEAERLTAWGKHYSDMQERGEPATFEQMEFAERIGGFAKQARKAGATVGGAMRAERRAEGGVEFRSWEELTGGKDAAVKKAAETAAETFAGVLKTELGTPSGGVVRAITDGIIRQIEQEASRQ